MSDAFFAQASSSGDMKVNNINSATVFVGQPTVVFDIDGTLANIKHRQHFVQGGKKNWKMFNAMMVNDTPNEDIVTILRIIKATGIFSIVAASGRGEESRAVTEQFMRDNDIPIDRIYMRKAGDYRRDDIVKEEILDQMIEDGFDVQFVFDDRNQVVDMWRRRGIRCFQVADGNF